MLNLNFLRTVTERQAGYLSTLGHTAYEFVFARMSAEPRSERAKAKARRKLIALANTYRESFPAQAKELLELASRE